jgi:hypothetical protein
MGLSDFDFDCRMVSQAARESTGELGKTPTSPRRGQAGAFKQRIEKDMKSIILLIGVVSLLFTVAGCEEEHEHHHGPYGGAYDGNYQNYGHGEYQGYPNYGAYPYGR